MNHLCGSLSSESSHQQTKQIHMQISLLNLSLFKGDQHSRGICNDFKSCVSVNRLLTALNHYSALKVATNTEDQRVFITFIKEVYGIIILDDYHHLSKLHHHELEHIMEYATESESIGHCDLATCNNANRRYRVNDNTLKSIDIADDHDLWFYMDIMDSIHVHIYHLYDMGMRISSKKKSIEAYRNSDDQYFDIDLSRQKRIISNTRKATAGFERINTIKSTKFNIKSDNQYQDEDGEVMTALDSIYQQIPDDQESIDNLRNYVKSQHFDTESMEKDLELNGYDGNIASCTSLQCVNYLINMFRSAQSYCLYTVHIMFTVIAVCFVYFSFLSFI